MVFQYINIVTTLILAVVVYLMVREIYLIKEYSITNHARPGTTGPLVGSNIKNLVNQSILTNLKWQQPLCIVATSPECPLCQEVSSSKISSIRKTWKKEFNFIEISRDSEVAASTYTAPELFDNLAIHVTPFCFIVDKEMNVLAGGLVNSPIQIESLLESVYSKETTL